MDTVVKPSVVTAAAEATQTAPEAGVQTPAKNAELPKGDKKQVPTRRDDKLRIFCGTSNPALAKEVCDFLGLPLGQTFLTQFSDGEIYVQILENVRGADVFVIQPTCDPVSHNLVQLLLIIDALKRASARRITW